MNPGDSIDVAVRTDEVGQFDLNLYDNEGNILRSKRPASGEEVTFDIEEESGTYVLMVLGPGGDTEAIAPVVAREYDVADPNVDPANPAPGDDVTVTTTVTGLEDSSDVALVIWNGDEKRERSMTAACGSYDHRERREVHYRWPEGHSVEDLLQNRLQGPAAAVAPDGGRTGDARDRMVVTEDSSQYTTSNREPDAPSTKRFIL